MNSVQLPEPPELPEVESSGGLPTAAADDAPLALGYGVHVSIPERIYHRRELGLASKSALDLVHQSPAHYKAWVDGHDRSTTPTLIFGSAFHCAVLEPERFARKYAVEPNFGDCRYKENKARRDEWRRANAGRELLAAEDMEAIQGMVRAIHAHPLASKMVRDGDPELTVRWQDAETGIECKARADYFVRRLKMLVDVKSTDDAGPEGFARSCAKYGYHRQDAFYRQGFAAVDLPVEHFVFIAVEKTPPYAVGLYSLDEDALARGRASIAEDLATLAECLRTGTWPGYPTNIRVLPLPKWAA